MNWTRLLFMRSEQAEAKVRAQLRKALDRHIQSGASQDSESWRKVQALDSRLRALRGQA